ncbi:histidine phosphotransferase family protein [Pseudoprimorskyibacter insulae]|uniref:Histidine phosphotransferase ChpT C-terminal domain-containing protein n=1 Tax=Pseudoprimorskyibacter insulae TaxID=1695997 RepID=A0A2R8AZ34_9RHOB|nr:histidine phosphotransferase family protein [Pseudoprimorskyibacter insulae]SPF81305.1 hypothetical protein PRI8871_03127 [Pseudoprimorskyibacter insulae]
MKDLDEHLPGLIGSRICHDLISPIGAICNGLELLELSGQLNGSQEITLIQDSVRHARARIELFRVAFGRTEDQGAVAANAMQSLLNGWSEGSRHEMTWATGDPVGRQLAQMALLAFLCVETSLPRGGIIKGRTTGDGITLVARGDVVNADGPEWQHLRGQSAEVLPAGRVQFSLLRLLLDGSNRQPRIVALADGIELSV